MKGAQGTDGGAIYIEDGSTLTISDSYFERNMASVSGGAIYASYSDSIKILNCEFIMNKALSLGSHIYIAYVNIAAEVRIENSKFKQQSIINNALYFKRSKANL
jgi:predicted outer membrane repeat protein